MGDAGAHIFTVLLVFSLLLVVVLFLAFLSWLRAGVLLPTCGGGLGVEVSRSGSVESRSGGQRVSCTRTASARLTVRPSLQCGERSEVSWFGEERGDGDGAEGALYGPSEGAAGASP